jgi:hypothetical protein
MTAVAAASNVIPIGDNRLEYLKGQIVAGRERTIAGGREFVEGTLQMAEALREAREKFDADADFGKWLADNGLDLPKDDRAALIGMAGDIALARTILTESTSRSCRLIWSKERDRFRSVAKPRQRAADVAKRDRVVAELERDPKRSNRAVAEAAKCHHKFVGRVRKQMHGQTKTTPPPRSNRVVGKGSISALIRKGIALDANNNSNDVAKTLGIGVLSYRQLRDIVLLSDRDDLSPDDAATVREALREVEETRRPAKVYQRIKPIVERVWKPGSTRAPPLRKATLKRRADIFVNAIEFIHGACERGPEIEIPQHLDAAQIAQSLELVNHAHAALRQLAKRIKRESKERRS